MHFKRIRIDKIQDVDIKNRPLLKSQRSRYTRTSRNIYSENISNAKDIFNLGAFNTERILEKPNKQRNASNLSTSVLPKLVQAREKILE